MTTFNWKKCGHLFDPTGRFPWMASHAQVPFSLAFEDCLRVYFSTRDAGDHLGNFKSYSGYVDLDPKNFSEILRVSSEPVLPLGGSGSFDEFGSMAGSVVRHGDGFFLYYCGWQRMASVPYSWSIGLAYSDDGVSFEKVGKGPILGPTMKEPYLQACPIVFKDLEAQWHMFYLSGLDWLIDSFGKYESRYVLMHATSSDGINWNRNGVPVLSDVLEDECQTSSSIIFKDGLYHMFFSYRSGTDFRNNASRSYRIGYAYSEDLMSWTRDDSRCQFEPCCAEDDWDSQMMAYPHVQAVNGEFYMFYCGNSFGKDGFGYAVLDVGQ